MYIRAVQIDMGVIAELFMMASFLVVIVNRLVEGLIKPLFDRLKWDKFYLMYVSWLLGGMIVAATNINLFYFIEWRWSVVGVILSALVAGGGANLLNDVFDMLPGQSTQVVAYEKAANCECDDSERCFPKLE